MNDCFVKLGRYTCMLAFKRGVFWVRKDMKEGFKLSAPWNQALFSERYGYSVPIRRFMGFRLFRLLP